jgi:uncharacterized protein (DUF1697 family)
VVFARTAAYPPAVVWAALLRAVNLGARNKVPMAPLRELFEREGCSGVRTYVQSGNVVFAHPSPDAEALAAAIAEEFGVETVVVLRKARQLRALVARHPFGEDTSSSHVAFAASPLDRRERSAVLRLAEGEDGLALVGGDIVLRYPHGFQRARLTPARLERALGFPVTARNWRTVTQLAAMTSATAIP